MISFSLNNELVQFEGNTDISLLNFLRNEKDITSVKDGCSGQGTCGACLVEIDGKPKLSCTTSLKNLDGKKVLTLEGIPFNILDIIAKAFVKKGAVQCGFCTPGFLMRTKILFDNNPTPTKEEIRKALSLNLCRCTGYAKIIDAIILASDALTQKKEIVFTDNTGRVGTSLKKYQSYETAIGKRKFVDDLKFEGMYFSALKFSEYPRAKVIKIDFRNAEKMAGVIKIFTAKDIPGEQNVGLIYKDWPLMINEGQITHYIGDVIA